MQKPCKYILLKKMSKKFFLNHEKAYPFRPIFRLTEKKSEVLKPNEKVFDDHSGW